MNSKFVFAVVCLLLLSVSSLMLVMAQDTPDSENVSIEEAMLFSMDFEEGIAPGIIDWDQSWAVRQTDDGNSVYCNLFPRDWGSFFTFGNQNWTNYALEADIQLISSDMADYGYTLHFRIKDELEGYGAGLYTRFGFMNFNPPYRDFGGSEVSINPGEWHTLRVEAVNQTLRYFFDNELISEVDDDRRANGQAGISALQGTEICVDNIRVWAIDENDPITPPPMLTSGSDASTSTFNPDTDLTRYEGEFAFAFVDGSEPGMPIRDGGRGPSYVPQPGDSREQIVIDETFSVPADEEVIWEDKIVWIRPHQEGVIEVYGTLTVRNSLLLWEQTQPYEARMYIQRGGTLNIESSYAFSADQYRVEWYYQDGSTIFFDHFVGDPWTVISGSVNYTAINFSSVYVTLYSGIHDTNVQISDAHSVYFEISPSPGVHDITFPAKFEWVNWTLPGLWPNTTIKVERSYLFERDITLLPNTHVTIRDVPGGLGLGWNIHKFSEGIVECELRGLGDPEQESVFYEYQTWRLPCINSSLILINSRLQKAWPYSQGNIHLRTYDSNFIDTRAFSSNATYEIYDSTIENAAAYDGARMYLENVRIIHDLEVENPDTVIYGYNVRPWEPGWEFEIIEVNGGQYIELDEPGPPWE